MAVGARNRFEVFKRDKFTCQYCGRNPPTVVLHCDHIVPQSDGGGDEMLNLITSCMDCNLGKSNVPLGQVTRPIADQINEAAERRSQVEAYNRFLTSMRESEERDIEELGHYWFNLINGESQRDQWVFGVVRIPSIRTFLRRMPKVRIIEAMDISTKVPANSDRDEKRWKYFCGVCWNMIREAEVVN